MSIVSIRTAVLLAITAAALGTAHRMASEPSDAFISVPLVAAGTNFESAHLHSTIIHRQHVNRGIVRLHQMKGREVSSDLRQQLARSLHQRVVQLPAHLQKRYYHISVAETLNRFTQHGASPDGQNTPSALKASTSVSKGWALTESNNPSFKHSIPLSIQSNDLGYLGKFQIGTPPRYFTLLMDSGSADLWVGSERCISDSSSGKCGKHTFLGNSSSSTYNATNEPWIIQYGTGQVFGSLATDVVSVAGMKLPKHKFGVATFESNLFTGSSILFDGICGLAKYQASKQRTPSLLGGLFSSKLISAPIVSFKIPRSSDSNPDGEVTFGAMNPAKYDPSVVTVVPNVNQHGVWEAELDRVKVGGKDVKLGGRTGVFDTGTSLLLAPEEDVAAIHEQIPNARYVNETGWTVPCNLTTSFSLTIGGREFPVDAKDIAWVPVDPGAKHGECISGISAGSADGNAWLVGDVFLKNVYLSTNEATDKITIAKLAYGKK